MPADWWKTRARILERDPTCQISGPHCTHTSTEVDHIVPAGGEHDGNLQGVCRRCHGAKTQVEAVRQRWPGRSAGTGRG